MVLVILPAHNEEKNIGRVIRGLFENGYKNVVVVDDGSSDNTSKISTDLGVSVIRHEMNRGQGAALETGDEYARRIGADLVVHFDADDQFNPVDIASAISFLELNHLDVVLGTRFKDNRSEIPFFKKYLVLPAARLVNFLFTFHNLSDVHNGFRVLNKRALEKIKITQDRMAHNTEIVQQIKKNNLNAGEVPVEVRYAEYGQGIAGGFKIIQDLIVGLFT